MLGPRISVSRMDQSGNYVFTHLMRSHSWSLWKCGFKHGGAGSHVLCAGVQISWSTVLCGFPEKYGWVALGYFMASLWMPPSKHSVLLDLLGVAVRDRWGEVLASGQTHHLLWRCWSDSCMSSFCATVYLLCKAVDRVYTVWSDCSFHKLDYSGWKSQFVTHCRVSSSTKSLDRSLF